MVKNFLVLIALIIVSTSLCYAFDKTTDSKEIPVRLEPTEPNPSGRPHSPSNQEILCEYSDGCLNFSFRYPEGVCELTVTECDGRESCYTFDSTTDACIYVGTVSTAHLLITTEYGHSYIGEM